MRVTFQEQLDEMHSLLIKMGMLCEEVIDEAFTALMNEDKKLASVVIKKDKNIDLTERDIEGKCLKLLLQQQPVASDLRKISAALKMITDMERIGDQAADIAEIVKTGELGAPIPSVHLGEMAKATIKMVRESIDSFVKSDLQLARKVIADDDKVDELFAQVRKALSVGLANENATQEQVLDLLMIAKYYERIGDHATNIAEWVEYSITGVHRSEEIGEDQ
ncbi:MAG TPA: phosphate signaling complex protein PhoU [Candidatus Hungatella pullicola]|nr:phosphate signaling complex protein PhoU [Candidatus Hungatella pullicola]